MSASDHLSGEQFPPMYHGTTEFFQPGDVIRPAIETGNHNLGQNTDRAWAARDAGRAKDFAEIHSDKTGKIPLVYKVSPVDAGTVNQHKDIGWGGRSSGFTTFSSRSGFKVEGFAEPQTEHYSDESARHRDSVRKQNDLRSQRLSKKSANRRAAMSPEERASHDETMDKLMKAIFG